jgi:hypothetical protein
MTDPSLRSQSVILFTYEHLIQFNLIAATESVDVHFHHLPRLHCPSSVTLGAMSHQRFNQRHKLI